MLHVDHFGRDELRLVGDVQLARALLQIRRSCFLLEAAPIRFREDFLRDLLHPALHDRILVETEGPRALRRRARDEDAVHDGGDTVVARAQLAPPRFGDAGEIRFDVDRFDLDALVLDERRVGRDGSRGGDHCHREEWKQE